MDRMTTLILSEFDSHPATTATLNDWLIKLMSDRGEEGLDHLDAQMLAELCIGPDYPVEIEEGGWREINWGFIAEELTDRGLDLIHFYDDISNEDDEDVACAG